MRNWVVAANPLAQLTVGLFALVGSYWIHDVRVGAIALAAYAAAVVLFAPGWRYPLLCLAFTGMAAATIFYSTWRLGGHDEVVHLVELGGLDEDAKHRAAARLGHHFELVAHQQHQDSHME